MNYIDIYKGNIGLYQDFVKEIIYTIEEESKSAGLKYADLKGRVKTIDSVLNKIERHNIKYPDKEINDYAGARIVCLFEEEKIKFSELLEKIFEVKWKENKKQKLGSNQMGYQSIHYCVKFGKNYSGSRYNKFNTLISEVQITTVLLEAWALINHTLVYKNESAIPTEIQRDMNNVSALLEVAQKVFDDSFNKRKDYISKIEKSTQDENSLFSLPIDFDTLTLFSKTFYPEMEISEYIQNKLIYDINKDNFKTLGDLNKAITNAKSFIENYKQEKPDLFKYSTDVLTKSLGYTDMEFRKKHGFAKVTLLAFEKFEKSITHAIKG